MMMINRDDDDDDDDDDYNDDDDDDDDDGGDNIINDNVKDVHQYYHQSLTNSVSHPPWFWNAVLIWL